MKKRLLFILYELSFGGVERQAELLAEAAKAEGHEVTLLVLGDSGPAYDRFVSSCKEIKILKAPLRKDWQLHRSMQRNAVQGQQYDLAFLFKHGEDDGCLACDTESGGQSGSSCGQPNQPRACGILEADDSHLAVFSFARAAPGGQFAAHTLRSLQAHPYYHRYPLHVSLN